MHAPRHIFRSALVVCALAVAGIAGISATSQSAAAQSIELRFGTGGGYQHYGPRHHAPRRHFGHRRHAPPVANICGPRQAVGKASAMGVRNARLVRNAPRRVAVRGYRGGYPVRVVFANQRGCPVIATR